MEVWTNNKCNRRLHGNTRKVPAEVFETMEKQRLKVVAPVGLRLA